MTGPNFPNITPLILPGNPFDSAVNFYGHRTKWMQSHFCPCTNSLNSTNGQADPACQTCFGRGYYWDNPVGPFMSRFVFTQSKIWNEPGAEDDAEGGLEQQMNASITIPFDTTKVIDPTNNGYQTPTGIPLGHIWSEASLNDAYIEIDTIMRFETTLIAGHRQVLPYQENLTIAPTGAVTTYNTFTHQVVPMTGYTIDGAEVIPPSGTPDSQGYTVVFHASPVFVAWNRAGSYPLNRPAGGGQVNYPRTFQIQTLDTYLRAKGISPATGLQ